MIGWGDFVVNSAVAAAKRTVRENEFVELTQRDRRAFVEALLHAPSPNAKLREVAERHSQIFTSSAISDQPQFYDIEPLGAKHDKLRAAFSCGVEPLDRYLKQQASQDARRRAAVAYVLVSRDDRIAGYYTLSSDNIRADDLPPD